MALGLLSDYEAALVTETNPSRKLGYRQEIARIQELADGFQQEFDSLRHEIQTSNSGPPIDAISGKLDRLNAQLETLRDEQQASERRMLSAIFERLDAQSELTVKTVLAAAEAKRISAEESQQLVLAVEQHLDEIAAKGGAGAAIPVAGEVAAAIKDPSLDANHKLKVSIPIVPLLLSYEAEIGLGSGVNLKNLWDKLVAKVGGRK